jgi:hypothetical protein
MAIRVSDTTFQGGSRAMDARTANDRIAANAEQLRFVSRVPMLCECSVGDCRTVVLIGLADYREIRRRGDTLLLAPGHDAPGAELHERTPDYEIRRIGDSRGGADGGRRSA